MVLEMFVLGWGLGFLTGLLFPAFWRYVSKG